MKKISLFLYLISVALLIACIISLPGLTQTSFYAIIFGLISAIAFVIGDWLKTVYHESLLTKGAIDFARQKNVVKSSLWSIGFGICYVVVFSALIVFAFIYYSYKVFGLIFAIPALAAVLRTVFALFAHYNLFPLNNSKQYEFNLFADLTGITENGVLTLEFYEAEKGVWKCTHPDLVFDLRGCLSARLFIKAYFVRQYNYREVNKRSLRTHRVCGSLRLSWLKNKKYADVKLVFNDNQHNKTILFVVKGSKTLSGIRTYFINTAFARSEILTTDGGGLALRRKMNEKKYRELDGESYEKPYYIISK